MLALWRAPFSSTLKFSKVIRRSVSTASTHPWFQSTQEEDKMVQRITVYRENADQMVFWNGRLNTTVEHFDGTGTPYRITRKLGFGGASNVWLAKADKRKDYVVLKILNSNSSMGGRSEAEIMLYLDFDMLPHHRSASRMGSIERPITKPTTAFMGRAYVRRLRGIFELQRIPSDENSFHLAMIFDPLGDTIANLMRGMPSERLPLNWTKKVIRQVLAGLSFLHIRGVAHGDVHIGNIMYKLGPDPQAMIRQALEADPSPSEQDNSEYLVSRSLNVPPPRELSDLNVELVDMSSAIWTDREDRSSRGYGVWACRSPEKLLKISDSTPNDIWGIGCAIFEMLTGTFLFNRIEPPPEAPWTAEHHHLMRMGVYTGLEWPSYLTQSPGGREYFDEDGQLDFIRPRHPHKLAEVLRMLISLSDDDVEATVKFMLRCLQLDPLKRATADDLLSDPWLN